jgi:hypothetical protein
MLLPPNRDENRRRVNRAGSYITILELGSMLLAQEKKGKFEWEVNRKPRRSTDARGEKSRAAAVENEIEALRLRPKITKGKIELWLRLNQTWCSQRTSQWNSPKRIWNHKENQIFLLHENWTKFTSNHRGHYPLFLIWLLQIKF